MLAPGKSSVEVEPEIFDFFRLGKLYIINMDRWAGRSVCREGNMGRLAFVSSHSPFLKPALKFKEVGLQGLQGSSWIAVRGEDGSIIGEGGSEATRCSWEVSSEEQV
jgi:hypothetical protein